MRALEKLFGICKEMLTAISGPILSRQIEDVLQRVDATPTLDERSPDEILGYDEHGLPR